MTSPPHITETRVVPPQGRYQAASRDLGLSQPPQDVNQLTHPLDTAGGAVSGDPGLRRAQTRQSALNFVVCAVLFRLFGTVGLFNKLQTQKKKQTRWRRLGNSAIGGSCMHTAAGTVRLGWQRERDLT